MRKFIFAVVLMLAIYFILARTAEVSSIVSVIRQADWRFLSAAVLVMLVWLADIALCYWAIYRAMGMEEKYTHLLPTVSAAFFVNIVAPAAGMSGIAVFISEARRKGISQARVTVAGAVVVLMDYIGFLAVLTFGLIVLIRRSTLSTTELVATVILLSLISVLGIFLYTGMRSEIALGNMLAGIARRINRIAWPFLHREYIAEYRAHEFAHDASGGLYRLRHQPKGLLLPAFLAFLGKICLLLIFFLCFLAFNVPYSGGTIIAGWSLSYLFQIVTITPGGVGFVEGLMPLFLATLNVPLGAGTVITLAYRAITFWLPLLIGLVSFRWLMRSEKIQAAI